MKFLRIMGGIIVVMMVIFVIAALKLPPSKDIIFRTEMSLLEGAPVEFASIVEYHKLSLTPEEKNCLNRAIDFYDNKFIYMSKDGVNNLVETKRRAYEAGYSYPDYRRRLIGTIAADKCSGLGREK